MLERECCGGRTFVSSLESSERAAKARSESVSACKSGFGKVEVGEGSLRYFRQWHRETELAQVAILFVFRVC